MKLKKTRKPGVCAAMRCKASATATVDGDELCDRHAGAGAGATTDRAPAVPSAGPALRAEIVQPIEAEATALRDKVAGADLVVASQAQLDAVGQIASYVQSRIKEAEAQRKRATQPLVQAKREIDSWFKPALEAYRAAKDACSSAMSRYVRAQEQARATALAAGDHDKAMEAAPAELPAGSHLRKRWVWRVTDVAAVPREFLAVDAARVQAVVDEQRERTSIPGIEAYEDTTLVTRGA